MATQLTLGNLLDPLGCAPSTAQEWLFPTVLAERGGPFVGHVPHEAVPHQDVQVLLRTPCPYAPPAVPDETGDL